MIWIMIFLMKYNMFGFSNHLNLPKLSWVAGCPLCTFHKILYFFLSLRQPLNGLGLIWILSCAVPWRSWVVSPTDGAHQCVANVIFLWRMNIWIYSLVHITHKWMSGYIRLSTFFMNEYLTIFAHVVYSQMNIQINLNTKYGSILFI